MHNAEPVRRTTEAFTTRVQPVVESRIAPAQTRVFEPETVVVEGPEEEAEDEDDGSRRRGRRRYSSESDDSPKWAPIPEHEIPEYGRRNEATYGQAEPYVQDDGPPSIMMEGMDVYDKFRFAFMTGTRTDLTRDDDQSDMESSGADVSSASNVNGSNSSQKASPASRIFSSYYTGNAELGGLHTATLTMLHDPRGQKQPLFRWL
jgi:hypothetical protein